MIPQTFNYNCPGSLDEAVKLCIELGDEAKYMSGGHSLIPMMKLRFATPEHIIDISRIKGLSYIKEEDGMLKIGGLTTEYELEISDLVKAKYPILLDAAKLIADPSVRNKATIGGNLAHGDAANDHPAVMLALRATVVAYGENGSREVSIDDFFHGFYMTALEHGEILTEIKFKKVEGRTGSAYSKIERKVGDYAASGVAVNLVLDSSGTCTEAGIGLTNVNPTPMRAERSENVLRGKVITEDLIKEAAKYASEDCNPSADLRGSEEYKRSITGTLTARTIRKALERAN